ncbi:hypothetical protein FQA39_LY11805 [Lamprigera yunnana]|nr:hypothetical protein FQA39_LY11805 [Lamprigera yunnana]
MESEGLKQWMKWYEQIVNEGIQNENNITNEVYAKRDNHSEVDSVQESDHNSDTKQDGSSDGDIPEGLIFLGKDKNLNGIKIRPQVLVPKITIWICVLHILKPLLMSMVEKLIDKEILIEQKEKYQKNQQIELWKGKIRDRETSDETNNKITNVLIDAGAKTQNKKKKK